MREESRREEEKGEKRQEERRRGREERESSLTKNCLATFPKGVERLAVPESEDSEGAATLRWLSMDVVEATALCGGLWELRSRSQKLRSTSPMSVSASVIGGLISTPTLTKAWGDTAPGVVSGEELDTSEQLSSSMAERVRVTPPGPSTYMPPRPPEVTTFVIRTATRYGLDNKWRRKLTILTDTARRLINVWYHEIASR